MIKYIISKNESDCYGCRACEQVCPRNAISIIPNIDGFLYPVVNFDKCIGCNLCKKVCPVENQNLIFRPIQRAYAFKSTDHSILSSCSSGGAFPSIADYILKNGGYVAGCVFDKMYNAIHIVSNNAHDVYKMRGSKYVQSNLQRVYIEIKKLLLNNKIVLFSGTPCQVAGLYTFLQKKYENLLTIDIICHGVPSQKIFQNYLTTEYREKGTLLKFKFRDKETCGWSCSAAVAYNSKGRIFKRKLYSYNDSYMNLFHSCSIMRYSCYTCKFAQNSRVSDLTIGDYWMVDQILPKIDLNGGVSVILVNTIAGQNIVDMLARDNILIETSLVDALKTNHNLNSPSPCPSVRKNIYDNIAEQGYLSVADKVCKYQFFLPFLKSLLPLKLKKILRRVYNKLTK